MTTAIRLGCLGTDSSHLVEFARRIRRLNELGKTRCLVTSFWSDGQHAVPADQAKRWEEEAIELGVRRAPSMAEVLEQSDGILVLAVDSNRHFPLAMPVIERGLPLYINQPFAGSLSQAQAMLDACRANNARCFSASSLRFAPEVQTLPRKALGEIIAIDATGPAQANAGAPNLFEMGVHTVEFVDALFAKGGIRRVRAASSADRESVELEYTDGRVAHLRLERKAAYGFAAIVHGTETLTALQVTFAGVYDAFVEAIVGFFSGNASPVDVRDQVERVAVLEAGNRSLASGSAWIDVPIIR